jgi:hypothetical protein
LLITGYAFILCGGMLVAHYDKGILYKLCSHQSVQELRITVIPQFTNL